MIHSAFLALTAALVAPIVEAATVEHWWNITYVADANPSGLEPRRVIGVNGTWPPPPVAVTQNDTLIIHAYNGLGDSGTSLHSHGIFFNGSSYYDGAVGVTQCPIPPGGTLDYVIPTDLQSGTYWIHSHYNGQYVDGLRTPFIIYPLQKETYVVDEEYTIVIADWYNGQHSDLIKQFLSIYNPTGAEPIPDAPLLYIYPNNTFPADDPTGQTIFNGSAVGDNAVLRFQKGKTYRLRYINMSGLAMFYVGIDGHDMKVIELDGVETEPYPATLVPLSVAQRISVLVTARNDTEADEHDWALIANMNPDMFDDVPDSLQLNVSARITYAPSGTPNDLAPATIFDAWPDFDDTALVPLEVQPELSPASFYSLNAVFDTFDDGVNRASFNNITYQSPIVPSIITALTMPAADNYINGTTFESDATYAKIYGAQTQAVVLKHLDVVELTIYNWDAGLHPFHLHGHKFQLIQKNLDASQGIPLNTTLPNPMRRDTVMVPPGGSTTVRFTADNPGVWFFHCHIEWHLESGLAMTFIEAPEQAQSILKMPQQMIDHCKALKIPVSGNAVGKMSTTDFSGQPNGPYPQTHILGWTPKAKGALAGCVLTAVLGMLTIVWYSMGALNEEEVQQEQQRRFDRKLEKKEGRAATVGRFTGVFRRS